MHLKKNKDPNSTDLHNTDLIKRIEKIIKNVTSNPGTETRYREPLVGFASTEDPIFDEMKETIGQHHMHPKEVFPGAKTLVSFFLPFDEKLVELNRKASGPVKEWIRAKGETEFLIAKINEKLASELATDGINSVVPEAVFDHAGAGFNVAWSHKSAAYAAGLGTFGVHHMLITKVGCAGRFGTLLISAEIPPTPRPSEEYCRHKKGGICLICVDRCPAGALRAGGLDKEKCFKQVRKYGSAFPELKQVACGKCATGPCALRSL